jgi:hypothetical protein
MTDIPLNAVSDIALETSQGTTPIVAWLGIGMLIVFFVMIAIIAFKRMFSKAELHGLTLERIRSNWEEIERVAEQGHMGKKMAIVEADKLLDAVLKSMAMPGTTLGERLKFACYKYPNLKNVWFAHRLRNQLVHETTFEIGDRDARSAVSEYKKALKELKVL